MTVAWSDSTLASSARSAAREIAGSYGRGGESLLFQGHWGFQYYMEQAGATALDGRRQYAKPYVMVMPENNMNLGPEVLLRGGTPQLLNYPTLSFVSDMNVNLGTGFYSSAFGALPYLFGAVPAERYFLTLFK